MVVWEKQDAPEFPVKSVHYINTFSTQGRMIWYHLLLTLLYGGEVIADIKLVIW